jgi:hypothetical protein
MIYKINTRNRNINIKNRKQMKNERKKTSKNIRTLTNGPGPPQPAWLNPCAAQARSAAISGV